MPAPQDPAARHFACSGRKDPRSLSFIVLRFERRPAGEFIVTFENGEVWQQDELNATIDLARGEVVVIRRRAGSFVLESRTGLSTKVRRVR